MTRIPLLILVGCACVQVLSSGCAKHADFVELRKELRETIRAQMEANQSAREQKEAFQERLQALERAMESERPNHRLQELAKRMQSLEERVDQFAAVSRNRPLSPPGAIQPLEDLPPLRTRPLPSPLGGSELPPPKAPSTLGSLTPTSAFNLAYNDYLNGRYNLSIAGFQRFLKDFPRASLVPNAHYWLGESYYQKKDYVRAMKAFQIVVNRYPRHEKVPSALFKIGQSAAETGDGAKARGFLKRVIEEYSTSNEAHLAKNKLAEIQ